METNSSLLDLPHKGITGQENIQSTDRSQNQAKERKLACLRNVQTVHLGFTLFSHKRLSKRCRSLVNGTCGRNILERHAHLVFVESRSMPFSLSLGLSKNFGAIDRLSCADEIRCAGVACVRLDVNTMPLAEIGLHQANGTHERDMCMKRTN